MGHFDALAGGVLTLSDFQRDTFRDDRRGETRVVDPKRIVVMPFGIGQGMEFQSARLLDCSREGVAIQIRQPLRRGDQFMIKARLKHFALLIYTVINCGAAHPGYRVGAQLAGVVGAAGDRDPALALDVLLAQ